MADKVTIINLTPWVQGFTRINQVGHVSIPAYGRMNLDREEVVSQCYDKNVQFVGIDAQGSHARIYVDDADLRKEFEFETDTRKQNVLTDEKITKLFEYKRMGDFEKNLKEYAQIHAEKFMLIDYIKKHKVNDYDKIKAVERYVGIPIEQ
ncbi:MAG: hypothetical protein PHX74_06505 [Candidatus Sumerlaeales bacterium]|nr:hypothetical protein [Candidatus Sumerlaeales bacterium]